MSKFKVGDKVRWKPNDFVGVIKKRCNTWTRCWYLDDKYNSCHENHLELIKEPTTNGTFPPNKSAKQLGIDLTRKFEVVNGDEFFVEGEIITFKDKSADSYAGKFWKEDKSDYWSAYWSDLKYAEEPNYKKYLGKKYAVHCKTQEEWDRVCDVLIKEGIRNERVDDFMGNNYKYIKLNSKNGAVSENWQNDTILSFKEFMGEEGYVSDMDGHLEEMAKSEYNSLPNFTDAASDQKFINDVFNKSIDTIRLQSNTLFNKPNIIKTTMNKIQKALRTKEQKAFEHFGFGTPEVLNEEGREAYTDYVYETADVSKKGFQEKVVELWQEETKK